MMQQKSNNKNAKERELNNWKKNDVYEVLPYTGQKCVSTRWVFTEKFIDGKKAVKARLVARGFEEETNFQVDSPTCSKEALRLASTLMMTKGWKCNSIDVRAAFLQGKQLERMCSSNLRQNSKVMTRCGN